MVDQTYQDPFHVQRRLQTQAGEVTYYSLEQLSQTTGFGQIAQLPYSIKILLEAALRQIDHYTIEETDVRTIASWQASNLAEIEIPFKPARVVMQDFTGVPAVVDLAAMRNAIAKLGGNPAKINPVLPVDLVIDHSVQVDYYANKNALAQNAALEFDRNRERYAFLRWGAQSFADFRVVPPATGIVHQVNLEYLANVVQTRNMAGQIMAYPDSLVGTDSHTTMINGLGVLGWGVGGIEAEAAMLNQPMYMLLPEVVGFRLYGELPQGATATDLVLVITQQLRKFGVVGKFVEFFGEGLDQLPLADRATIANMAPEYGATMGFFPIDHQTLEYLRRTSRPAALVDLVERYAKAQGLFRTNQQTPTQYTAVLELDMNTVEPSIAGPKRPQDRLTLKQAKDSTQKAFAELTGAPLSEAQAVSLELAGKPTQIKHGSVVIAAITSCTNTSNPSVMVGAGLLAKKAVEAGLQVPAYVKTSLAPGSRVVTRYLEAAGVIPYLDKLGYNVIGYGCTTCIGNSGPLADEISKAIQDNDLVVAAVLSGNRNFEGRIHQDIKANYLASPLLVIAYSLAGTVDIDFAKEPIGYNQQGKPVFLKDIWPTQADIATTVNQALKPEMFAQEYGNVFTGNPDWNAIPVAKSDLYPWDEQSTYIQQPPYFTGMALEPSPIKPLLDARVLAVLGDSVTTDHISPAGAIAQDSPAGQWLMAHGVDPIDFNTYGARRGHHEVMMRGTFANIRIRNKLVPGVEGAYTKYLPTDEKMFIYDAAMRYQQKQIPLVILAGKEYGTGSSRDWAAKGTMLLGIKIVIAESYERIHRSNLIGMGVLPLQFQVGQSVTTLDLDGTEIFSIPSLNDQLKPRQILQVVAQDAKTKQPKVTFDVLVRIDTAVEVDYYRHGGILHTVLRSMAKQ